MLLLLTLRRHVPIKEESRTFKVSVKVVHFLQLNCYPVHHQCSFHYRLATKLVPVFITKDW